MAPLAASYSGAAEARAELLSQLCGFNAFVSLDRVLRRELGDAIGLPRISQETLLSSTGDWFPVMELDLPKIHWADQPAMVAQELKSKGVPRAKRREFVRNSIPKGKLVKRLRELSEHDGLSEESLDEILRHYPMRPEDAKTLREYVLGRAGHANATEAFLNSLRDPSWMMRWFEKNHNDLGSLGEMLREPAKNMIGEMQSIAAAAFDFKERWGDSGVKEIAKAFGSRAQDELLLAIANKLAKNLFPEATLSPLTDVMVVAGACPGLSVAIRSAHSILRNAVAESGRQPKESDFVDIAHAIYSPRVSLFRTDRCYMASHVATHLGSSAKEVSKLDSLLPELLKLLLGRVGT